MINKIKNNFPIDAALQKCKVLVTLGYFTYFAVEQVFIKGFSKKDFSKKDFSKNEKTKNKS